DKHEVESQRRLVGLYGLLADDIGYIADFSRSALELFDVSPEAARHYWRRYSLSPTTVRWDGGVDNEHGLVEAKSMVTSVEFRGKFVERIDEVRKIANLEPLTVRGENLAEAVGMIMCRSHEHMDILTSGGVMDVLRGSFRGRKYLVEEFVGSMRADRLNTARAYLVLMESGDRITQNAREFIRKGQLTEDDLALVDWSTTSPENIVDVFERVSGEKRRSAEAEARFKGAIEKSGFPDGVRKGYLALCEGRKDLRSVESFMAFSDLAGKVGLDDVESLLNIVGGVPGIMRSQAFASRVSELSTTPCSSSLFVRNVNGRLAEFSSGGVDDVVNRVFHEAGFQETLAVESTLDWSGFEGKDRKRIIGEVIKAPAECKGILVSMRAGEIREELDRDAGFTNKLSEFLRSNSRITDISTPVYIESVGDGRVFRLNGVREKSG
ncbi:MAG: hypothetical protein NTU61_00455, partial [Candidatus Altiarchaeota archaeon]|nr:hypothetical protein [Candidatus Altiarchaeota archaeon]